MYSLSVIYYMQEIIMGDTQTQATYPKGLDFEQVWTALMETREYINEHIKRMEKFFECIKK